MTRDPTEERTLPVRGLLLFASAACATIAFVAIAERVLEGHADDFDRTWALAIHSADHDVLDWIFIALTIIGSGPCLWGGILLVSVLAIRNHLWPLAMILAANGILAQVVNVALKHWFVRQRPTLFDEITRPETFSFPSGHSTSAVQIWGAIAAVLIALHPRLRPVIVPVTLLLIAGIGLSRVYLGVHWPTDVVAGFAAGVPFLVVTIHLLHRIKKPQ